MARSSGDEDERAGRVFHPSPEFVPSRGPRAARRPTAACFQVGPIPVKRAHGSASGPADAAPEGSDRSRSDRLDRESGSALRGGGRIQRACERSRGRARQGSTGATRAVPAPPADRAGTAGRAGVGGVRGRLDRAGAIEGCWPPGAEPGAGVRPSGGRVSRHMILGRDGRLNAASPGRRGDIESSSDADSDTLGVGQNRSSGLSAAGAAVRVSSIPATSRRLPEGTGANGPASTRNSLFFGAATDVATSMVQTENDRGLR